MVSNIPFFNTNNLHAVFWCQVFDLAVRVFTNGPRDQVESYQRRKKMIHYASLLNTQHYKVRLKGKWSSPEKRVAPFPTPRCSSYRKGRLWVTLFYGRQLYLLFIWYNVFLSGTSTWAGLQPRRKRIQSSVVLLRSLFD